MDEAYNITSYYVYDGIGLVAKMIPSGSVYFYHYNGSGNTIAMTDSSANMVNKYAYEEFGNLANVQESVPNPFMFVGQYGVMDDDSGLLYMRARYYDPQVGRFINKDPFGFLGGDVNHFCYVENNPINWVDPWGLLRFKLFGQTINMGLSVSFLPVNIAWDPGGNISFNAIFPPLTVGGGLDVSINPPASSEGYVSLYLGLGKNLSIGTNVCLVSRGKEPVKLKVQGFNFSLGPSLGFPIGALIPNAFSKKPDPEQIK